MTCHHCGVEFTNPDDLRPYGPGGALVCHPCATSPEHEEETEAAFAALLDATSAISSTGIVVIGEPGGPQPFDPSDLLGGPSE